MMCASNTNLWGLREERYLKNITNKFQCWKWCPCFPLKSKVGNFPITRPNTPVSSIIIKSDEEEKISHDSFNTNIPRQSSGSESSGYFTPPPTERPSAKEEEPIEIRAVTPLPEPQPDSEPEPVDYIEVIHPPGSVPEIIQEESPRGMELEDLNENILHRGVDETDRKFSSSSLENLQIDPINSFQNKRSWSRSEIHLNKTLPLIDRKNINSAPLIKDTYNNNTTEKTSPNIVNNINISIPLPGALVQEEPSPSPVRKLSKRYSQVPVLKKPPSRGRSESSERRKQRDVVQDVLQQLSSSEWETVMSGLRGLAKIAKNQTDALEPHMHNVSLSLATHIKNLRSQVARAACQASRELFLTCSNKGVEADLEDLIGPLLHRTADTNKFLREDANSALDTMSENVHPTKALLVLSTRGLSHQNAVVRATTTRLLDDIVKRQGTEKIFSMGREVRDRVILAGANGLTEGSLETRKYAKSLLKSLIPHPNFQKALFEAVPPHTIRHIAKTLNSLK